MNLTERRFRALWEQTDKDLPKDEYRFRAVMKILQSEPVSAPRGQNKMERVDT